MTSSGPIGSVMHPLSCKPVSAGKKAQRVHFCCPALRRPTALSYPSYRDPTGAE